MRISDFQNKDVVNIKNGNRLGNIIDIDIDMISGNINKVIIYNKKSIFSVFKQEELEISWSSIKKVGDDVILIDLNE